MHPAHLARVVNKLSFTVFIPRESNKQPYFSFVTSISQAVDNLSFTVFIPRKSDKHNHILALPHVRVDKSGGKTICPRPVVGGSATKIHS